MIPSMIVSGIPLKISLNTFVLEAHLVIASDVPYEIVSKITYGTYSGIPTQIPLLIPSGVRATLL